MRRYDRLVIPFFFNFLSDLDIPMKLLRNLLTIFVVFATLGVGVLFALQNKTAVPLDLLVYSLGPQSLALWVLGAFALGGVLGVLVSSLTLVRTRASLGSCKRQLNKARDEVTRLRSENPIADAP
jgi:putative membrane protein